MNIVFCADGNFSKLLQVAAFSVVRTNPGCTINVIKTDEFCTENLQRLCDSHNCQLRIFNLDVCDSLKTTEQWSSAIFARLAIPEFIPNGRALYMDCDTITTGSLAELFELDMEGHGLAAADDKGKVTYFNYFKKRFDIPMYFNSGVLLMDCDALNESKLMDKTIELIRANDQNQLRFTDQDALNIVFNRKFKLMPQKFNHLEPVESKDAVVYHYAIGKPWLAIRTNPNSYLYKEHVRIYPYILPKFSREFELNEDTIYPILNRFFWNLPGVRRLGDVIIRHITKKSNVKNEKRVQSINVIEGISG